MIGLLGSSIFTVINCGSTQWNLKKPPIIRSNSGQVPTCVIAALRGGAGGGRRRRRQDRGEARGEILLAHLAGLFGVEFVEPGIGQRAQLVAAELLIAVLVARQSASAPPGLRPGRPDRPALRRQRQRAAASLMVGIAGGVNARQSLAGADELEQRLLARVGGGGIVRDRPGRRPWCCPGTAGRTASDSPR